MRAWRKSALAMAPGQTKGRNIMSLLLDNVTLASHCDKLVRICSRINGKLLEPVTCWAIAAAMYNHEPDQNAIRRLDANLNAAVKRQRAELPWED